MIDAMPSDSTQILQNFLNPSQWTIVNVIVILGSIATIVSLLYLYLPYRKNHQRQRLLARSFGSELFTQEVIERSIRYYIPPNCTSVDPSQEAEIRHLEVAEEKLFEKIDKHLQNSSANRHLLLLADSGMGKTSFVLNYYARNQILSPKKRHRLAVIPLGIANADEYILKIENKNDTILFLDAFDEDIKAIDDHRERLLDLMSHCRDFKRVLITCRTQFFPSDEEIPVETGIARIGPRRAGEKGVYEFWKLYLSPMNDNHVKKFLKKRYSIWQLKKRSRALEFIQKVPLLTVRPMLLAYIPDLLTRGKNITFSFEIYEEMVEAWLEREVGILKNIDKKRLRNFSERLAVDLYTKQEQRGDRIPRLQLLKLAEEWSVPLEGWKLTGRSLLNRDALGNYKFAHRSIMEYLFVKCFAEGAEICRYSKWTDQMQTFLWEMIQRFVLTGVKVPFDIRDLDLSRFQISLRSTPLEELKLSEVRKILEKLNFYDKQLNKNGKGVSHLLQLYEEKKEKLVIDYSTGLIWQHSDSVNEFSYYKAKSFIEELNGKKYAGYDDWRLPTLEEAMSLMSSTANEKRIYIDSIFENNVKRIWTQDQQVIHIMDKNQPDVLIETKKFAWFVDYYYGFCNSGSLDSNNNYVCAVRTIE